MSEETIKIEPFTTMSGHIHQSWFEVEKKPDGVIIMCPEGCRRYLMNNGIVAYWDESQQLWVKGI